jgi:phosphoglycerate dehydrogenase-like enzyme
MPMKVAIVPNFDTGIAEAVERGGGTAGDMADANALVWTDPFDPAKLRDALGKSAIEWVQLPFAGIERFFEAGVIDDARVWTCTKGAYGHSTAEHALALTLMAARRLHLHAATRSWSPAPGGVEERSLQGSTVVIVGTGGIGSALTRMLRPLQARIIGVNRSGRQLEGAASTVRTEALRAVAREADFLVVAAALTPETKHLIDRAIFGEMKKDAWLVNVARGGLVDHDALLEALQAESIGGAALDVTDPEPLPDDHPLWTQENVVITPHVANTWRMALPELRAMVERNVAHFIAGEELEGVVDPSLGY